MKKKIFVFAALVSIVTACNNSSKDSVKKTDTTNEVIGDTTQNRNTATVDEYSSSFLVKTTNGGLAEVELTSLAGQKAVNQSVKDLAAMLHKDHMAVNDQVKALASQKNITLPVVVSDDKQKDIDELGKKTGKDFEKSFLSTLEAAHKSSIASFEQATTEAKDADIRSFAEKTLPTLRSHLQAINDLQKNIK